MNSELNKKLGDIKKNLPTLFGSEKDLCFFTDCNAKSIKSHSISETRVLSLLEGKTEKNKIVILHLEDVPEIDFSENKTISTYKKTHRKLFEKGKNNTSIFYGFCSQCDSLSFLKLDKYNYENNNEVNFLHTLRTQAHNLTIKRNLFRHLKEKLISPLYEADKSINYVQKEIQSAFLPIIDTIPNDITITWEAVSSNFLNFNESDNLPHIKLREDIKSQHQNLLSDLSNQSNYPMTGKMYKSKIINIIDVLNDAIQVYNRNSTSEFEILLEEQIKKVENEMEKLTSLYRNDNKNDLSFLSISLKGIFLIAGGFVYHLNNGSTITLTFFPEKETSMTNFIFCEQKQHGSNSMYLNHLNIMEDIKIRQAISDIILSVNGNVFLSPLYYKQLDKEIQTLLLETKTEIIQKKGFNLFKKEYLYQPSK